MRDPSGKIMSVYRSTTSEVRQSEVPLYGSSRLGQRTFADRIISTTSTTTNIYTSYRGQKSYELSNHLGNVLTTVSDYKQGIATTINEWEASYYLTEVRSASDYYPFGLEIPNENNLKADYRYGFNGKENDKDWGGDLIQDYGFRLYNPRYGKFLSVDPLTSNYPRYSPYQFAG